MLSLDRPNKANTEREQGKKRTDTNHHASSFRKKYLFLRIISQLLRSNNAKELRASKENRPNP
jgi:hypothetical protein